jgi:hypothetical protein
MVKRMGGFLMKLYSEEKMETIRTSFEKEILQRSFVKTKRMFGCPSYTGKDKLFAFLVTQGVVLTSLSELDREAAFALPGAQPFEHNKRVVKKWVRVPIRDETALQQIMPFVMKSYEHALEPVD